METVNSYARALGLEVMLIPRKHAGRVRALLHDDDESPSARREGRVPTLAELIDDARDAAGPATPRGSR